MRVLTVIVRTLDGEDINVNEKTIALIAGPYLHDVGPHTYIYGATHGALITNELADILAACLVSGSNRGGADRRRAQL